MAKWRSQRRHSHDHEDLSGTVTGKSPGSWKAGPRSAFRTWCATPQRPVSHDHDEGLGRRCHIHALGGAGYAAWTMRLPAADVRFRPVGRREVATLARTWRVRLRSWAAGAGPGLAVGLVLGLLALGPGLRRGFLLSYDMVIVPRQPFTAAMAGLTGGPPRAVPSDAVVAAAARVLPADIVQKLVLLSIFVLACSGAAALLAGQPWYARLAAGV